MQRRRFSREFKIEAVKLVRERGVSEVRSRNDRKRFSCVAIDNGQKAGTGGRRTAHPT